jgi:quinol monooxygenase YgiN
MTLTVIATIKAKVGKEAQMQQDLMGLVAPSRIELGCINFDLLLDNQDPSIFILYENWESQADLDAHYQQPYVRQVFKSYEETLAEPIVAMFLTKIG